MQDLAPAPADDQIPCLQSCRIPRRGARRRGFGHSALKSSADSSVNAPSQHPRAASDGVARRRAGLRDAGSWPYDHGMSSTPPSAPDGRSDELVLRLRGAGCVFAEEEAELLREAASDTEQLDLLADRRVAGEPLEHLLGWVLFRGRRLAVAPGVFVPRTRSEILVSLTEAALDGVPRADPAPIVVELCCGVAAVTAALLSDRPGITAFAADIDPAAVACAERNLGGRASALVGDLYSPLPDLIRGRVDVIVANAPYVPTDEIQLMPPEARDHEPLAALDGGIDGLHLHRRIAAEAGDWLRPGGVLIIETSRRQADTTRRIFSDSGLAAVVHEDDEVDGTAVVGRRTA